MTRHRIHQIFAAALTLLALTIPADARSRRSTTVDDSSGLAFALVVDDHGAICQTVDSDTGQVIAEVPIHLTEGESIERIDIDDASGELVALVTRGGQRFALTLDPLSGELTPTHAAAAPSCKDKPVKLIRTLQSQVQGLVDRMLLTPTQGEMLNTPLQQARLNIRVCQIADAITNLNDFILNVERLYNLGALTRDQATYFSDLATQAITILAAPCAC